jgi:hypothetical protein
MKTRHMMSWVTLMTLCFSQLNPASFAHEPAKPRTLDTASAKAEHRRILRGTATYTGGIQSLRGDVASFKKHGNHGPITWFDEPFRDGTFRISWQHELEQTVTLVFDHSAEGNREHVLKVICQPKALMLVTYGAGGSQHRYEQVFAKTDWHQAEVSFTGAQVRVVLDGVARELKHPGFISAKTSIGVMHGWGTLKTRDANLAMVR